VNATRTNWAGNLSFRADRVHRPGSVEQLQEVVASGRRVRALGTGHSFSPVADTTGDHVSVAGLPARFDVGPDRSSVTVSAGLRYGEVATRVHAVGLGLANLGSLPHISVAGAVATGTHGSGEALGSLATSVVGLELVTASGELLRLDGGDARFPGAVVALGSLGVVTAVTLATEPSYDVAQRVFDDLPAARLAGDLDEVLAAGDSVSIFTTWRPDAVDQVWVKRRTDRARAALPDDWLGATAATAARHPVAGMDPAACTTQLGRPGPWHERLPHFRLDHTPSHGDELQTEYLVDRAQAGPVIEAVDALRDLVRPVLFVSELRTVAADDLWLSPAYGRDSLAVHFTWRPDAAAVRPVVDAVEDALAPFGARPHWGKVFTTRPDVVAGCYPRFADACALRDALDPDDVFGNEFLDAYLPRGR
jgi:xylitol oxidase